MTFNFIFNVNPNKDSNSDQKNDDTTSNAGSNTSPRRAKVNYPPSLPSAPQMYRYNSFLRHQQPLPQNQFQPLPSPQLGYHHNQFGRPQPQVFQGGSSPVRTNQFRQPPPPLQQAGISPNQGTFDHQAPPISNQFKFDFATPTGLTVAEAEFLRKANEEKERRRAEDSGWRRNRTVQVPEVEMQDAPDTPTQQQLQFPSQPPQFNPFPTVNFNYDPNAQLPPRIGERVNTAARLFPNANPVAQPISPVRYTPPKPNPIVQKYPNAFHNINDRGGVKKAGLKPDSGFPTTNPLREPQPFSKLNQGFASPLFPSSPTKTYLSPQRKALRKSLTSPQYQPPTTKTMFYGPQNLVYGRKKPKMMDFSRPGEPTVFGEREYDPLQCSPRRKSAPNINPAPGYYFNERARQLSADDRRPLVWNDDSEDGYGTLGSRFAEEVKERDKRDNFVKNGRKLFQDDNKPQRPSDLLKTSADYRRKHNIPSLKTGEEGFLLPGAFPFNKISAPLAKAKRPPAPGVEDVEDFPEELERSRKASDAASETASFAVVSPRRGKPANDTLPADSTNMQYDFTAPGAVDIPKTQDAGGGRAGTSNFTQGHSGAGPPGQPGSDDGSGSDSDESKPGTPPRKGYKFDSDSPPDQASDSARLPNSTTSTPRSGYGLDDDSLLADDSPPEPSGSESDADMDEQLQGFKSHFKLPKASRGKRRWIHSSPQLTDIEELTEKSNSSAGSSKKSSWGSDKGGSGKGSAEAPEDKSAKFSAESSSKSSAKSSTKSTASSSPDSDKDKQGELIPEGSPASSKGRKKSSRTTTPEDADPDPSSIEPHPGTDGRFELEGDSKFDRASTPVAELEGDTHFPLTATPNAAELEGDNVFAVTTQPRITPASNRTQNRKRIKVDPLSRPTHRLHYELQEYDESYRHIQIQSRRMGFLDLIPNFFGSSTPNAGDRGDDNSTATDPDQDDILSEFQWPDDESDPTKWLSQAKAREWIQNYEKNLRRPKLEWKRPGAAIPHHLLDKIPPVESVQPIRKTKSEDTQHPELFVHALRKEDLNEGKVRVSYLFQHIYGVDDMVLRPEPETTLVPGLTHEFTHLIARAFGILTIPFVQGSRPLNFGESAMSGIGQAMITVIYQQNSIGGIVATLDHHYPFLAKSIFGYLNALTEKANKTRKRPVMMSYIMQLHDVEQSIRCCIEALAEIRVGLGELCDEEKEGAGAHEWALIWWIETFTLYVLEAALEQAVRLQTVYLAMVKDGILSQVDGEGTVYNTVLQHLGPEGALNIFDGDSDS